MPTYSATRQSLRFLGIAAVMAAVVTTTACQQEEQRLSPSATATAYMEAIADSDAGAANALSREDPDYPLPLDDSLDGAETITDIEVGDVPDDDDVLVEVPVSYSLGSERYNETISLVRTLTQDDPNDDEPWQVSSGVDHPRVVAWTGFAYKLFFPDEIDNGGVVAELKLGSTVVKDSTEPGILYPGVYDVATDVGPYADVVTTAVTVAPDDEVPVGSTYAPVEIELAPSEQLLTETAEVFTASIESFLATAEERGAQDRGGRWVAVKTGDGSDEELFLRSLVNATIDWSLPTPAEVTWQKEDGLTVRGTAVIRASWTTESESGVVDVPVWNSSSATPKADGLDVLQPSWTQTE